MVLAGGLLSSSFALDSASRPMLFLPKSARIHKRVSVYKCKQCGCLVKKAFIVRDGPVDHGFCDSKHALAWLKENQYVLKVSV